MIEVKLYFVFCLVCFNVLLSRGPIVLLVSKMFGGSEMIELTSTLLTYRADGKDGVRFHAECEINLHIASCGGLRSLESAASNS